jgi:vacuolar protein sorting-associated protein 13A/C
MDLIQSATETMKFVSSADCDSQVDRDLLSVVYERVDKASPEFLTTHDGIDQSVDIQISTFIFRVAPEPILDLYDFIMTTFVPHPSVTEVEHTEVQIRDVPREPTKPMASSDSKILVKVNLASVQGW